MQCTDKSVGYQILMLLAFVVVFMLSLVPEVANAGMTCDSCHGMPPLDSPTGTRDPATGAFKGNHQSHSGNSGISCVPCHGATVSSYATNHSASLSGSGSRLVIRLTSALNNYSIANTRASYSRGTFFNQTSVPPDPMGTCSNVNCHFENTTPAWGATSFVSPDDCDKCHGAPPNGGLTGASGSHAKHNTYYPGATNCQKCHPDNTTFQHATSAGNRPLAISFTAAPNNGSGSYTGPLNDYLPSQTNIFGVCNATYCHSNGTSVSTGSIPANTTANWGYGALVCTSCHAYPPAYTSGSPKANSHGKHSAVTCDKCHYNTSSDGVTITNQANHVNKAYNVNAGVGISFTYSFAAGGGTCSTINCHFNGNATWGGTVTCGGCHSATNETMTTGSHATHLSALKGPNGVVSTTITCDNCHGTGATTGTHTGHGNGAVAFADGNLLASTSVCDTCHSPGGPYDGVNDAAIGAKPNWSFRVYTGSSLKTGKERWCVTCHDSGISMIQGRQAPDLAGNSSAGYGYYNNGHGLSGTECGACHGLAMNHKIDGKKTFRVASSNYKLAFRLNDVGGQDPLSVPRSASGCDYNSGDFRLCFSCHNEQALMNDSRSAGTFGCTTNSYKNAPLTTTQHKNVSLSGFYFNTSDIPANIHWDHLVDVDSYGAMWKPDGVGSSAGSCTLCHNPHGGSNSGTPSLKMTHGDYQLIFGSDVNGDYGHYSGTNWTNSDRCAFACHGSNLKYYRPYPYPNLDSLTLADNNPADPSPAEAGYTNARAVTITIAASGNAPTQMIFAEDGAFTVNSTGWIAYSGTFSYTLTAGDGTKTLYGKLKNASGDSETKSASIILDQTSPTVPASSVTSPNGAEVWGYGTTQNITWNSGGISDANLKSSPVTIDYSTNSGSSYPNAVVAGVANNGTYSWPIPSTASAQARVRLTFTDKAGNQAHDYSNDDFTIRIPSPVLSSISVADSNDADPSPADSGYTNNRTVAVTLSASNIPDQMMLAEDAAFTTNSTGWITYATSYNYTLSAGDGIKMVYAKVQNSGGVSATQSAAITLDTTPPSLLATTLTSPNGAESWLPGSNQTITWGSGAITDANLKTNPISLDYSTDSGATWPNAVASSIANSGSFGLNPLTWSASYSARVRITATDKAGNSSSDSSDNNFAVSTPYIVTNTSDTGAGSLRQVLTDVIAAGGNNAIWFNIPGGSLTNGVAVITPTSNLPAISQSGITIDGGSQTAFGGNTNPNGPEVRIRGTSGIFGSEVGFNITAANTTLKNMQIAHFMYGARTNSANTVIDGNHLGFTTDSTGSYGTDWNVYNGYPVQLLVGSTNAAIGETAGNYISCNGYPAISDAGSGTRIMNNTIGLLPNGASCKNNNFSGSNIISIDPASSAPTTNCLIQGNTICGDASNIGIYLGQYVEGCSIKGNIFGLRYNAGTWTKVGALSTSIDASTSSKGNNTIGGSNVASSDVILNDSNVFNSAITGTATIYARSNAIAKPNKIFGNFIGTNPAKTQTFGGKYGVLATTPNNSVIGGGGAGEAGNVIANMSTNGVYMENASGYGVRISRNSFYNNGTSAAGSDDAIKMIAGANGSTTRPAISAANTTTVTVGGVLSGETVEVYISDYSGSGTQYGEGITFVGSAVSTGTSVTVPVSVVSSGNWVTAIRILANQNTSPFSANVAVP